MILTKIEWIDISQIEGKTAIDNFINGQPNIDIRDTIELGTQIGIIYNEGSAKGRGKSKTKKPKKEATLKTKSRKSKW